MSGAVILFGHGARDPAWADPMRRLRARMLAETPGARVELAFLEMMTPALGDAIDMLAVAGHSPLVIVPLFLAQSGHVKRDVPALIAAARERHPGTGIVLAPAVGEAGSVLEAMAAYARACLADASGAPPS